MIYGIQYLRAVAATFVVVTHIAFKSSIGGLNVFENFRIGAAGVDLFFVISGFLMAKIYCPSTSTDQTSQSFLVNRILRIFPFYWLVTTVAMLLYTISPTMVNAHGGPTSVWRSYLLLPTTQVSTTQFLIAPGWTLSFELYFYAIFAAAFVVSRRSIGLVTTFLTLLLLALGSLTGIATSYLFTSPMLLEFAYGILIYVLFSFCNQRISHAICIPALGGAVVGFFLLNQPSAFLIEERWWRAGVPTALLLIAALSVEHVVCHRPVRWAILLGEASYALYLTHAFALGAASRIFTLLRLVEFGAAVEVTFWMATLVATLGASCAIHRYIELPLNAFARRIVKQYLRPSLRW